MDLEEPKGAKTQVLTIWRGLKRNGDVDRGFRCSETVVVAFGKDPAVAGSTLVHPPQQSAGLRS